jgi:hypothetical protein
MGCLDAVIPAFGIFCSIIVIALSILVLVNDSIETNKFASSLMGISLISLMLSSIGTYVEYYREEDETVYVPPDDIYPNPNMNCLMYLIMNVVSAATGALAIMILIFEKEKAKSTEQSAAYVFAAVVIALCCVFWIITASCMIFLIMKRRTL